MSGANPFAQQRASPVFGVAEVLGNHIELGQADVEADRVRKSQRSPLAPLRQHGSPNLTVIPVSRAITPRGFGICSTHRSCPHREQIVVDSFGRRATEAFRATPTRLNSVSPRLVLLRPSLSLSLRPEG
jgi:hypothetical protein